MLEVIPLAFMVAVIITGCVLLIALFGGDKQIWQFILHAMMILSIPAGLALFMIAIVSVFQNVFGTA